MYNLLIPGLKPLKYAVEANKTLTDDLSVNSQGNYSYALYGPNGFIREFSGNHNAMSQQIDVSMQYQPDMSAVDFTTGFSQELKDKCADMKMTVVDNTYGLGGPWESDTLKN